MHFSLSNFSGAEQSRLKEREQREIFEKQLSEMDKLMHAGGDKGRLIDSDTETSSSSLPLSEPFSLPVDQHVLTHMLPLLLPQGTTSQVETDRVNASLLIEVEQMKAACASLKSLYDGLKEEKDAFEKGLADANEELEEVRAFMKIDCLAISL